MILHCVILDTALQLCLMIKIYAWCSQLALRDSLPARAPPHRQEGKNVFKTSCTITLSWFKDYRTSQHLWSVAFFLACITGVIFFAYFNQVKASARRARSARHAWRERRKTINFPSSYVNWHFSLASYMPSFVSNEKKKNDALYAGYPFLDFAAKKKMLKLSNNANLISLTKYFR